MRVWSILTAFARAVREAMTVDVSFVSRILKRGTGCHIRSSSSGERMDVSGTALASFGCPRSRSVSDAGPCDA